ncbi:hypothetical protein SGLAM104S_09786 [Streptomyces glaucescens]
MPTVPRSESALSSRTSLPPTRTAPVSTSYSRGSSLRDRRLAGAAEPTLAPLSAGLARKPARRAAPRRRPGLLAGLLIAFPDALRLGPLLPAGAAGPLLLTLGAAAGLAVAAPLCVRRLRAAAGSFLRTALGEARAVHSRPSRALALWGGSLAFPALQAAGLVAVGRALGLPVPLGHIAVAYLAATVAVALIPTPGGIGSVEAALIVALVAAGGRSVATAESSRTASSRSGCRCCRGH